MEIRHLRYFVAVARTGHITRAAAQLGLQQPPLSQQIRALESHLGVRLLERHPKGVRLTGAGERLLPRAEALLADFDALRPWVAAPLAPDEGPLRVGFTSSAAAHAFTPQALRACRQRHPGIRLQVREANAAELTQALAEGQLDAAFLRVPVAHPVDVAYRTLLAEPAVVALPHDHALACREGDGLRLADLQDQPLLLVRRPGAPGLYAQLLQACAAAGVRVHVAGEIDRMVSTLNLVAAGAGLAVVPASMAGVHPHAIAYVPLDPAAGLQVPLTLAWRRTQAPGPLDTFVGLVERLRRMTPPGPADL